jgi:hypothetical protein
MSKSQLAHALMRAPTIERLLRAMAKGEYAIENHHDVTLIAAAEIIEAAREQEQWKPTHQHRKGGKYRVIDENVMCEKEWSRQVLYEDHRGQKITRPYDEFYDGRFTPL